MDLLAFFIGFIPMGIAILWFFELEGKAEERDCAPGLCGCYFLFSSGASLIGTLKSVFSHNLNVFNFCFFVISAVISSICFLIWKRS
jgi:hypothetical protein